MFDQMVKTWGDPEGLWLNLTNAALGLVCLVCFGIITYSIVKEILEHVMAREETHAFNVAGLGLTMADGGEPVKPEDEKKPEQAK
jgi:hypothetical protein